MRKIKNVSTYKRRIHGKWVTVRAHTMGYQSNGMNQKNGAGDEFKSRKISAGIGDIRTAAKALGITETEASSWLRGTDWKHFNASHLKRGDNAARKFLGSDTYKKLDRDNVSIPQAVLSKIKGGDKSAKGKTRKNKTNGNTPPRPKNVNGGEVASVKSKYSKERADLYYQKKLLADMEKAAKQFRDAHIDDTNKTSIRRFRSQYAEMMDDISSQREKVSRLSRN